MAVYGVSSLIDEHDRSTGLGELSLREAIRLANDWSGADIIRFADGLSSGTLQLAQYEIENTVDVTMAGDLDNNGNTDITITSNANGDDVIYAYRITGVAASLAEEDPINRIDGVVDDTGDTLVDSSRVFYAYSFASIDEVDFRGLVLTGGRSDGSNLSGGAIFADDPLTISDSMLSGNSAALADGGCVFVDDMLAIEHSVVSNNGSERKGATADAGGIIIRDSLITWNRTFGDPEDGGALDAGGPVTIEGITLTGNMTLGASSNGGVVVGLEQKEPLVSRAPGSKVLHFSDCKQAARWDASVPAIPVVSSFDDVMMSNSTLTGNRVLGDDRSGGALAPRVGDTSWLGAQRLDNWAEAAPLGGSNNYGPNGGAVCAWSGDVSVADSTIGRTSTISASGDGDAIFGDEVITITNGTVDGNSTDGDDANGVAIFVDFSATIVGSAIRDNASAGRNADGGGLFFDSGVEATDSTISGNSTSGHPALGGGLASDGVGIKNFFFTRTVVNDNAPSGLEARHGGLVAEGDVFLTGGAIRGNKTSGEREDGGCIDASDVIATRSTVSDNLMAGYDPPGRGTSSGGVNYGRQHNFRERDNRRWLDRWWCFRSHQCGIFQHHDRRQYDGGRECPGRRVLSDDELALTNSTVTNNTTAGPESAAGSLYLDKFADARIANSLVLGNASAEVALGAKIFFASDSMVEFKGQYIIGANPATFNSTAASPVIASGADRVENAAPGDVFATTVEAQADGDSDDTGTGVLVGVLGMNGGPRKSVARCPGCRPTALATGAWPLHFRGPGMITTTVSAIRFCRSRRTFCVPPRPPMVTRATCSTRSPTCPVRAIAATADGAQGEKCLSSGQDPAVLEPDPKLRFGHRSPPHTPFQPPIQGTIRVVGRGCGAVSGPEIRHPANFGSGS